MPMLSFAPVDVPICRLLPALNERPQFDVERPRAARLVRDMPDLVRDRRGLDEELVGAFGPALPGPLKVDHGIDDDVSDVYTLGTQVARHGLGEDPLCRLGWREPRQSSLAA